MAAVATFGGYAEKDIVRHASEPWGGLMVFGSHARGEGRPDSDVDVLQLVGKRTAPYSVGLLNYSPYTAHALTEMARDGSLFVLHLRAEGIVLSDPEGLLVDCLNSYVRPRRHTAVYQQMRELAAVFEVALISGKPSVAKAMKRSVIFALRTAAFARCADIGHPCFSLQTAALLLNDERLLRIEQWRRGDEPDRELTLALSALDEYLTDEGFPFDEGALPELESLAADHPMGLVRKVAEKLIFYGSSE